jgi:dihydroorotase (multifunctional complex type)
LASTLHDLARNDPPPARLLRGARVFDGRAWQDDWSVRTGRDGCIAEAGPGLAPRAGEELAELGGRWLLPGLVDCHVHFREPGLVRKEGYATGSLGALHGGVTTVCEIQNNPPLMISPDLLREKRAALIGASRVDFAPYGSLVEESLPHLAAMRGLTPAVKCFLGCSTGAGGVDDEATMRRWFAAAARAGMPIVAHCEDNHAMAAAARALPPELADRHDLNRPPEAEIRSIEDALRVAREVGARLHVFHISTAEGARRVRDAAAAGQAVSGSTAPHYLLVTAEEAHALPQNRFKVNPSIKYAADRDELCEQVARGTLCAIGTDHAPHPLDEKDRPYAKAPSGFPSVDLLLPLIVAVRDRQGVKLDALLRAVTSGPAQEFGLARKGRIAPGMDADLVIVDPAQERVVEESLLPSKSKWSPYRGWRLRAFPQWVLLRGHEVWAAGAAVGPPRGSPCADMLT